jgi:hypothetical protein
VKTETSVEEDGAVTVSCTAVIELKVSARGKFSRDFMVEEGCRQRGVKRSTFGEFVRDVRAIVNDEADKAARRIEEHGVMPFDRRFTTRVRRTD